MGRGWDWAQELGGWDVSTVDGHLTGVQSKAVFTEFDFVLCWFWLILPI